MKKIFVFAAMKGDSEQEDTKERDLELANVANADLDFATDDEKAEAEKATSEHQELFDDLKESLGCGRSLRRPGIAEGQSSG